VESSAGPLATLAALVVKEGVGLGGLPAAQLVSALALACSALPRQVALRETDVNTALKRCLAEEGRFLQTDHVELRRWLVDGGWLARDGFGREYRRVGTGDLPVEFRSVAEALEAQDPVSWVVGIRERVAAQREARRLAWLARQEVQTGEGAALKPTANAVQDDQAGLTCRSASAPAHARGSGQGLP
jgi:hypothetical protein